MLKRTAGYVDAILRKGDEFDYFRWLRRVQQEEGRLKSVAAPTSVQLNAPGPGQSLTITQNPGEFRDSETAYKEKHKSAVRHTIQGAGHRSKIAAPKKSPRQGLGDVCNAWDDFQENRDRDAVYGYLRAVFSIVRHHDGRRRTKRLMRCAYTFAGLPIDIKADPFAAVIRCTCEHKLDNKTISKWSRALRYVARFKKRTPLKAFVKNRGGINACAHLYAQHFARGKG
jgi:hypothetical protein